MRSDEATLGEMLAGQRRAQRGSLRLAALAGALVAVASVTLLGLSGWFITGAALAGAGGFAVAQAFNFLLPSAVIRLLAITRTGLRYVERISGHRAALKAMAQLRPLVFARLAASPPGQAFRLSSGEASARLVQDVDAVQTLFVRLSGPYAAGAGALAAVGLTLFAGLVPALVLVVGLGIACLGGLLIGRVFVDPAGRQVQVAMGALKDRVSALQAAAPELRAYGLDGWAAEQVGAEARTLDRRNSDHALTAGWIPAFQAATMAATVVGVIATSLQAPLPLIALAGLAAVTGLEAAAALTAGFRQNGAAQEALRRLADVLDEPFRVRTSAPSASAPRHPMIGSAIGIRSLGLKISPPVRLGISGPSGAGKTRLVETVMGLRDCPPDLYELGGLDLERADARDVRNRFAYASQDVRLLASSVADNLRLADPMATDDDLWSVLADACLDDRVLALPRGLASALGDNGDRLSGGERRRLGLARAYLRRADWLVLDEPTEGLDAALEARVLERLEQRLESRRQGLILVSHQTAPLALCDRFLALSRNISGVSTLVETGGARCCSPADQRP